MSIQQTDLYEYVFITARPLLCKMKLAIRLVHFHLNSSRVPLCIEWEKQYDNHINYITLLYYFIRVFFSLYSSAFFLSAIFFCSSKRANKKDFIYKFHFSFGVWRILMYFSLSSFSRLLFIHFFMYLNRMPMSSLYYQC